MPPNSARPGQHLGQQRLAAELRAALVKRHPVAAPRRDRGRLHAARPTADDHDRALTRGRLERSIDELAPGLGVLDARDTVMRQAVADAGLVAADAGADVVGAAGLGLGGEFGVADHRPRHAAHIRLTGRDDPLGDLRLVDAPGDEHRLGDLGLDRRGIGRDIGLADRHRREDVDPAARRGRRTGDDAEVIDHAVGVDRLADLDHLVGGQAALGHLVARDADAERHRRAGLGADAGEHLAQEPQPVVERAAVSVVARVGARVEELRDQIAHAGEDLDAIEAGLLEAPRGVAIGRDDPVDDPLAHRHGHHAIALVGRVRGRVRHRSAAVVAGAHRAPGVEQLAEDLAAVRVARVGQAAEARDAGIGAGVEVELGVAEGRIEAHALEHDQPGAARRARLVVGDQFVADQTAATERGAVGRRKDAVLQRDCADGDRAEQRGKGRHGISPIETRIVVGR